jgi:hypothetical protein
MSNESNLVEKKSQKNDNIEISNTGKQVFKKKFQIILVQIIGWALLINCVYRWIMCYYVYEYYGPLTHTTYLTMVLVSFICINKFESIILNSITSVSLFLFIFVSILFIPLAHDFSSFYEGVVIHFAIAFFQLYLLLNKKIVFSRKYVISGFLLYLIFISSYDSFARINAALQIDKDVPLIKTTVEIFYILGFSTLLVYFYKMKFGNLVP